MINKVYQAERKRKNTLSIWPLAECAEPSAHL